MILAVLLTLAACGSDGIITSSTYPEDLVVICGEAITLNDDTTMSDTEFMTRMEVARDLRHQCDYWNLSFPAALTPVPIMEATTGSSTPDAAAGTTVSETPAMSNPAPLVVPSAPESATSTP